MTFVNLLMSYNKLKIILTMILSEKREVSHFINCLPKVGMQIWQLEIIWNWVLNDWYFSHLLSLLSRPAPLPLAYCL
jgi:hypothetical protein